MGVLLLGYVKLCLGLASLILDWLGGLRTSLDVIDSSCENFRFFLDVCGCNPIMGSPGPY